MPEETLKDLLEKLAGITDDMRKRAEFDPMFHHIVVSAEAIHNCKQVLYGDYIQVHGSDDKNFALTEHFFDIKRKFTRAETIIKTGYPAAEELMETYMDLCVYAAMGVQLLEHFMRQEENQHEQDCSV